MGKIRNNQSGFSAIEGLLILVIVGIVGGTGWYVYNANKKTNSTFNAAGQSSQSTATFKKRSTSVASTTKTHTSKEAVTFTQKTYDDFLTAINNAGTNNTQPLGLVGLAAVKDNLTADLYTKAAASHNGGAFSCAAQFMPNKYTASLGSADKSSASIAMVISNSSDNSTTTSGMTVNVDLSSLKITAVNCPN